MLDAQQITEIATKVAYARMAEADLERIVTEPATDSEGHDALRITLILKPNAAGKITGDQALDLLVDIQQNLRKEGEERFPIVGYATEDEIQAEELPEDVDSNEEDA